MNRDMTAYRAFLEARSLAEDLHAAHHKGGQFYIDLAHDRLAALVDAMSALPAKTAEAEQ